MTADVWGHNLSFALRFNNHFTGEAVASEFPVRLDESFIRPVTRGDGVGRRHPDGTYRFVDVDGGVHRVRWLPPFENTHEGWISFDDPLDVMLPSASPETVIERDLWPGPDAVIGPSTTVIRGKLEGTAVDDLEVRVGPAGDPPPPQFTRTDALGEFVYLPSPSTPDGQGRVKLTLVVDGGARAVANGTFRPTGTGASFVGADFVIQPGQSYRVVFQIT